mgnify:CR=1 FL=1
MSQAATVHVLPTCDILRIFELRNALRATGGKLVVQKPKPVSARTTPRTPWGGDAA